MCRISKRHVGGYPAQSATEKVTLKRSNNMARKDDDTIWVTVDIKAESEKSWLLSDSRVTAWVQKSYIIDWEDDPYVGITTDVELPAWLAEEKGFA